MEFDSERSDHGCGEVKDERRSDSGVGDETHVIKESPMTNTKRTIPEDGPSASTNKKEEVDEIEKAKAKMSEVREENERLKICLNRVMNDYRTLQVHIQNITQQETQNSSHKENNNLEEIIKESELVSLSLGNFPSNPRNDEKGKTQVKEKEYEDLSLGLDCKFEISKSATEHLLKPSPENSSEVPKEEEVDEVSQENPAKKTRVCVRARCDTPTLNDGCQWRKYGQKISKGNPCPRAYYRCTVAPSCPVRKQVQRCVQDMSILITTYEGTHNHSLPLSATAMASATSAAASMLLNGSSTSHYSSMPPSSATTTTSSDLHGLNLYLPNDGSKPKQFYLSHPTLSISSTSQSHPTVTLDLTTSNIPLSNSTSDPNFGARLFTSSNYNPITRPLLYPSSTSLNFTSSESNAMSWSNGFLSYNGQPYSNNNNRNNILSNINNLGRQPMENMYHSYMQRNNINASIPHQGTTQHSMPDTIAAATKFIIADPSFQSSLAAALTSIIGTGNTQGNESSGEDSGKNKKWGDLFPSSSSRDNNN
ncbi:hypothetical protein Lal_00030171 [Lupinus albus]|uniref:Putative transcription factor WRKY family n=1 Tax=Lupinus albus TaxID=3870 RepID=A0A6A4Q3M0_LUPAL|nr:putative transcription factor WRKY family [Lupinus albus]KAF1870861.1 hypothetical protein Lal_00030171 [Lupinus albus]